MPITVTAPHGVLTPTGEREILPQLTTALAEASGLKDHPGFLAMVGGTVHLLDPQHVYAGGVNRPLVLVELKLPDLALPTAEARAAFVHGATAVVDRLTVEGHDTGNTWINILNARDGAWGIGGNALTNEALLAALES